MEEIIDVSSEPVKINNKKHIRNIIILTIFNILAFTFLIKTNNRDTQAISDNPQLYNFFSALVSFLFAFPLIGLILAIPLNLIPYKGHSYSDRYYRTFLLINFWINVVFALMLIFILIFTIIGAYPPKYS